MNDIANVPNLPDLVAEYDQKLAALPEALAAFEAAGSTLRMAASVGGVFGQETINTGYVALDTLKKNLLRSAWLRAWDKMRMPELASARDKAQWERAISAPAPFTLDNVRATFGPYLADPRATILRGMAEVFADLDPAYKSHEKVRIGVKGLPKRVIVHGLNNSFGYGWDKIRDIINALAVYQKKPLVSGADMAALREDGEALRDTREVLDPYESVHVHRRRAERGEPPKTVLTFGRGVWVKKFQNGNGHLFFGPEALQDINRALAEFYGDVLPDSPEADAERPAPRHTGTAVSKDLQFYPTPDKVISDLIDGLYPLRDARVLEPSCGYGRIMTALRRAGAIPWGVEVDAKRAAAARAMGLSVLRANFLDLRPDPAFDFVVMNPPFYGRHYAKHVRHAMRFLKPGGTLRAVLPATARYDHGLLDDLRPQWRDLPVGAFAESGTNVCTTICTIKNH